MRHLRSLLPALLAVSAAACTTTATDDTGSNDRPNTSTTQSKLCPAPTTFDYAVCATGDFAHVGAVRIHDGASGAGSLGVNGATNLVAATEIAGSINAYGGFQSVGATAGGGFATTANLHMAGTIDVAGDAEVGGDLMGIGNASIGGSLNVGGAEQMVGIIDAGARGAYTAPALPCDPNAAFDVAAAVADAAQQAGATSWTNVGAQEIHLPTGTYYVTAAQIVGASKIVVEGNASVFVDGSLQHVGAQIFELAPGGQLDLFVSGSVQSVGSLTAGDESRADAFRLWVGATGALQIVGSGEFFGSIYAPGATVQHVGNLRVVGSIFSHTIQGVGALDVEYGTPGSTPTSCEGDEENPEDPENPGNQTPVIL